MTSISTIGLDLAKGVFQVHGADASGAPVLKRRLRRDAVLGFFAELAPCVVAMEACASAYYWAREIARFGHETKLIAAHYVKPFVKRQKNDAADAEAICEAAQRPTMRFVAIKSAERQAQSVVFRARDLLVRQRTQIINALRGHLVEYGVVVAKGPAHVAKLLRVLDQETLPQEATAPLRRLAATLAAIEQEIAALDIEIAARAKQDDVARRLMTIPGVGPVIATAIAALAPPAETFAKGRDFAAWAGLTPRQHSSGGKEKLGRTTNGRALAAPPADRWRQRCVALGGTQASARRLMASAHAGEEAAPARHRRAGRKNGARRLGADGARRNLQSFERGSVSGRARRPWKDGVGRSETERYGATVVRRDRNNQR